MLICIWCTFTTRGGLRLREGSSGGDGGDGAHLLSFSIDDSRVKKKEERICNASASLTYLAPFPGAAAQGRVCLPMSTAGNFADTADHSQYCTQTHTHTQSQSHFISKTDAHTSESHSRAAFCIDVIVKPSLRRRRRRRRRWSEVCECLQSVLQMLSVRMMMIMTRVSLSVSACLCFI